MPDINTRVTQTLGYLLTDTGLSTDYATRSLTVSKDAVQKAKNVWDSYLKSAGWTGGGEVIPEGYPSEASSPSAPSASGVTSYPMRIADSSYYYALEFIAEEYLRIRIGNVGSQMGGVIQQTILAKAQALLAIAKDGIARYEAWCEKEAGIMGANSMSLVADAVSAGFDGYEQAKTSWETAVADSDDLDNIYTLPLAYQDRIRQAAYGYSLRLLSTKIGQRAMGFSGARNPAIAQYYTQQSSSLLTMGERLIAEFLAWVADTKQVLLAVKAYKLRDNGYGVVSLVSGMLPNKAESIFRVRSLVTGMPVVFDGYTQDLYVVAYQMTSSGATAWWWDSISQAFTMPVEIVPGDTLALNPGAVPEAPPAGVYKGELVVCTKGTTDQIGSYELFINVENPAATAFGMAFTLRSLRQIVGAEIATSPAKARTGQLDFDDVLLCRSAFNACDDWNTLMPDFPRKVQPSSYPETAQFRQGIIAHAFLIKALELARSAMGAADAKAGNVHAFEQRKADQFMSLSDKLVQKYRDDVIRCQRRIWNHYNLR